MSINIYEGLILYLTYSLGRLYCCICND